MEQIILRRIFEIFSQIIRYKYPVSDNFYKLQYKKLYNRDIRTYCSVKLKISLLTIFDLTTRIDSLR